MVNVFFSHGTSNSAGVCIMFGKEVDFQVHNSNINDEGRFIILDLTLYNQRITFVCLYGHNKEKHSLFSKILQIIVSFENTSIIMCGDLNVAQDINLDNYNIMRN